MELVDGEALSTVLRRERRLDPGRTLDIMRQTAGLAAAHAAGVVHRDVKPSNPLIGPHGTVTITDFWDRMDGVQRSAHGDRTGHGHGPVPLAGAGAGAQGRPGQ